LAWDTAALTVSLVSVEAPEMQFDLLKCGIAFLSNRAEWVMEARYAEVGFAREANRHEPDWSGARLSER
jgi:hypothetical protein